MVKREVLKIVNFLEDRLKEHGLHNARLIVFGSHATGQAHKGSDIDIAIVSDEFEGKDIFERAKMTQDAEILTVRTYRVPLDIVTLSTREYREGKSAIVEYVKERTVIPSRSPPRSSPSSI